jgi:hypothetical protein
VPERCIPVARLRVYPRGADGYTSDPGWAWWSAMASDADLWYPTAYGYQYGAAAGTPSIAPFENVRVGLWSFVIPTPIIYPYHTEIAQWTEDTGDWEERPLFAGPNTITGLWNLEDTGQLTSDFCHPEAPNFSVQFIPMGVPRSWDSEDDPPYFSLRWGHNPPTIAAHRQYEIRVWADGSMYLATHYHDGTMQHLGLGNIGWTWPQAGQEPRPLVLTIMHIGEGIAIRPSVGGSGNWYWYEDPNEAIFPAAGNTNNFEMSYRGGQAVFGFHGLVGPVPSIGSASTVNTFDSPIRTTDRTRAGLPTVQSYTYVPSVAAPTVAPALTVANIDHSGTDDVQLRATFTWGHKPANDCAGTPIAAQADFPMSYRFPYWPELYAAGQYFSPSINSPTGEPALLWSERIHQIDVDLPDEGDVAHARLAVEWDVINEGSFTDPLYMRIVDLALGFKWDDDSITLQEVLTGYIVETDVEQLDFNRQLVKLRIADTSVRLRGVEADDAWPAMDAWNAQTAALHVAAKCGWHASLCNFVSMAGFTLSEGRPDHPLWMAQPGQSGWDFLERIARYCGEELAVAQGGGISTRNICYFNVAAIWNVASTSIDKRSPPRVERRHGFAYTGVEVKGQTLRGEPLTGWQIDTNAESNTGYAYFLGYRRLERFEDAGIQTQADVDALAVIFFNSMRYRCADHFIWRTIYEPDNPAGNGWHYALRRDVAFVSGLTIGTGALDRLGIFALHHHWARSTKDCHTDFYAVPYPSE